MLNGPQHTLPLYFSSAVSAKGVQYFQVLQEQFQVQFLKLYSHCSSLACVLSCVDYNCTGLRQSTYTFTHIQSGTFGLGAVYRRPTYKAVYMQCKPVMV